jgi:[ribosomal protein S5]-alanine N-acetyltransferase
MNKPIEIVTARLLIRSFKQGDLKDLIEYTNEPEWVRYLVNIPYPYTIKDAENFLMTFTDSDNWEKLQIFAIVMVNKVIGDIYLNQREEDRINDRAELGFSLSRQHWGNGLMTEAAQAVINWAFQTYPLNRIFATVDPRNDRSWHLLEKLGMKREGCLRSHLKWNGEVRDQLYYGILRTEWMTVH